MITPVDVANWIKSLPNVDLDRVEPVSFKIGKARYYGAHYFQTFSRGTEHEYTNEAVYLVGDLPAAYKRTTRIAFRLPNDVRDWYVATYANAATLTKPEFAQYHPFGLTFALMPWNAIGQAIDYGEKSPRKRIPVTTF